MANEEQNLGQMRQAVYAARSVASNASYASSAFRRKLMYAAEERINLWMRTTEEAKLARDTAAEVTRLEALLRAEEDRVAQLALNVPFPVGTVMVLWKCRYEGYGEKRTVRYFPTEERGVVEVVTSKTVHPENMRSYSQAFIGSAIIRLLRKSGTPGKTYVGCKKDGGMWRPVGVNMDAEKNAALLAKEQAEKQVKEEKENSVREAAVSVFYGN